MSFPHMWLCLLAIACSVHGSAMSALKIVCGIITQYMDIASLIGKEFGIPDNYVYLSKYIDFDIHILRDFLPFL